MTAATIRGWCPTAWRPMAAGDGLLVRVRPRLGRVTRDQMLGLCARAIRYGNGQIDATNRANLQIRGVGQEGWPALIESLCDLGLVDPDPALEGRRAIIVAPDWRDDDDTHRIATDLMGRLSELPDLPGKMGFAIDAGDAPVLRDDPADFRIERCVTGGLILRIDGRDTGCAVAPGTEVDALVAIARWFVATGGREAGRMARHTAALPGWATGSQRPRSPAPPLLTGTHRLGSARGLRFGRIDASALADFILATATCAIRLTPWRVAILEGTEAGAAPAFDDLSGSAIIRTDACVGAPACPQATVETRDVARRLAPHIDGTLHVSGCAKGCARPRAADVVLWGRDGRFDVAFGGRAGDPALLSGLDTDRVLTQFGAG